MLSPKKYILYAYVKPYDLKLCLAFPLETKIRFIQEYIEDTMRNFRTKYKVGRIEHKKTSSILLPDFKIGETLENKDEIIVYSIEYGLTKTTLNDKKSLEDIDKLFIGKKTRRESKATSRKISIDKYEKNNKRIKSESNVISDDEDKEDKDEEKGNNSEKKDKEYDQSNDESESSESKVKNNNNKKKKEIKKVEEDDSSNSGDDKSEDIKL
jgi:hypothetical protein